MGNRNSINLLFSIHTFADFIAFELRCVFWHIGFDKRHILSLEMHFFKEQQMKLLLQKYHSLYFFSWKKQ